jgi:hypothetical protein
MNVFLGSVLNKIGFPMNGNKIKFRFGDYAFQDPLLCRSTDFCVTQDAPTNRRKGFECESTLAV